MSQENRTLLDAAVAPGTPVSRRPGARRLLEDCWTAIRNAVEPRITDVLLEALGPIARSENEDVAKPAKLALSRDRAFVQAYSDALQAEFKTAVADFVAHRLGETKAPERKALSLIDYGEMEFSTLIESSGARIRNALDDEYTSVSCVSRASCASPTCATATTRSGRACSCALRIRRSRRWACRRKTCCV
jgi:hypothetical protein